MSLVAIARRLGALLIALALLLSLAACGGAGAPAFTFVTNGPYRFWEAARAGVVKAGQDLGVPVDFRVPQGNDMVDQKQILEDRMIAGVAGMAVSVVDPVNQTPLLDRIAARVPLVTHDADAPDCKRRCFVGVDNYAAGRMAGELLRGVLPAGGKVALFVGNLSQDNARLRRQGVIDVLLGRDKQSAPVRLDEGNAVLTGGGFTIVGTYTDDGDDAKAKANVEDVMVSHADLAGMVGLFQHNPPACVNALRARGRLGQIAVVGFDEDEQTLAAIEAGHVVGTVVQNPYEYGYQAIRLLVAIARGDEAALPAGGVLEIPARAITRTGLDAFRAELGAQMAVLEGK
ncbi:MAG: sugar-binding protein [Planctomycetes bacterium]|nr:sugar-binding protein [Planctomycetota bacterium]